MSRPRTLRGDVDAFLDWFGGIAPALAGFAALALMTGGIVAFFTTLANL